METGYIQCEELYERILVSLPKTPWLQMHRKYVRIFSLLEVVCSVF